MSENKGNKSFSRFGYIMVAAGAVVGLGNIWKFPSLAYGDGGGAFVLVYIAVCILLGHPIVQAEQAIGRRGRASAAGSFGVINPKWRFVGVINILCTLLIDFYYVVVSGWVLKYLVTYIVSGDFGEDKQAYFDNYISSTAQPLIYNLIIIAIIVFFLYFGITNVVQKASKVIMPALIILLLLCGVFALIVIPGAADGLKYYFVPDFSKFGMSQFADVCMQSCFSVGIGWGIYTTLGASMDKNTNLQADAWWVDICDTFVALLAGFVVIPTVVGSGTEMSSGPSLVLAAMTQIFESLPGGRIYGAFFFAALILAVISTFFTIIEIPRMYIQEITHTSHQVSLFITAILVYAGSLICSLSKGVLSWFTLPWPSIQGIAYYDIYDWIDCLSGYVLLPLGILLTCVYVVKGWGFDGYEKELTNDGKYGKLRVFDKFSLIFICPVLTLIVILHVFGVI